jgi:hypothetical protein
MPDFSTSKLISDLAVLVWKGLALGLAYGLITMAIIQFVKDAWWREFFNRIRFNDWMSSLNGSKADKKQLIWLAAAGDGKALFSLPIEKMAGQIGVAASAVLESPQRYPELLRALGKDTEPREKPAAPPTAPPPPSPTVGAPSTPSLDDEDGKDDLEVLIGTKPKNLRPNKDKIVVSAYDPDLVISYSDARTRVGHRIQRQIDLLQLRSAQRWTRENRILSLAISGAIGLAPLYLRGWLAGHYGTFQMISVAPASILLSLIGGLLAPLLRDLVSRQTRKD